MYKNKQLVINMLAGIVAYVVSMAISFFLSPYIVENVGVEAYGFVGLANNFVSYAGLITIALNSLAGRFVTVKIYEKDIDGANKYFSSVFYANFIITVFLGAIFTIIVLFLDHLINIPYKLLNDIRVLFAALFVNCLISVIGSVFSVSTFATNKLYLNSLRTIESNILRIVLTLALFFLFIPRVSYIGIAVLISGVYIFIFNIRYTKELTPELKIKRTSFDIKVIVELVTSGVWNTISRVGQLLLDGLDLLITNLFINASSMGILSLAKIIPSAISGLVGTVAGVFSPDFTILYAQEKREELVVSLKQSIKIMSVFSNIPIVVLIICGQLFFSLWQPTQDSALLHVLSILTCFGLIFNGGINCIYTIFTVVNKLKWNSVAICLTGLLNIVVVFVLLRVTDIGIFAVAGVSSLLATIRNLVFTVPYGAHCLGLKWYTFYPDVIKPVVFVVICSALGLFINKVIVFEGWIGLVILAIISVIISLMVGIFVILSSQDRKYVYAKLFRR